jgi:hypothetical protein
VNATIEVPVPVFATNTTQIECLRRALLSAFCEQKKTSLAWEDFIYHEIERLNLREKDARGLSTNILKPRT